MGSSGAQLRSTFQRWFTWNSEINFLFMKKKTTAKVLRTKLQLFRDKTAEISYIAFCSISIFLGISGVLGYTLLQSHCCLRAVYDLCICPSWTECRGHFSCAAALTQDRVSPSVSPISLAAVCTSCCNPTVLCHSLSWPLQHLLILHLLPSPAAGSVGATQGCLCCSVLCKAADTIAMAETICLSLRSSCLSWWPQNDHGK